MERFVRKLDKNFEKNEILRSDKQKGKTTDKKQEQGNKMRKNVL